MMAKATYHEIVSKIIEAICQIDISGQTFALHSFNAGQELFRPHLEKPEQWYNSTHMMILIPEYHVDVWLTLPY